MFKYRVKLRSYLARLNFLFPYFSIKFEIILAYNKKHMGNFFGYLTTKTFRTNLYWALAVLVAFLLITFYSLRFYTHHGEGVAVPKLKGLTIESAIQVLESQGFRYQIDSVYQPNQAAGIVIEQDPDPNTNVKLNRTIYLTVITRLSPIVRFPELSNKTYLEAEATLSNFGLKVGDTTYVSDVAKDVVLQFLFRGRALQAGDEIPKGSVVNLVLGDGLGASEVDIPDLVGLTLSEARMALSGSSLKLGIISFQGSSRDTFNLKISRQSPALSDSLSKVPIGSSVDLVLGGN
jgi:beta-lactam-binding protein with PASTA domain